MQHKHSEVSGAETNSVLCSVQLYSKFSNTIAYEFISSFEYSDAMHIRLNNMNIYNQQKAFIATLDVCYSHHSTILFYSFRLPRPYVPVALNIA